MVELHYTTLGSTISTQVSEAMLALDTLRNKLFAIFDDAGTSLVRAAESGCD
jgi:hypothetical protein